MEEKNKFETSRQCYLSDPKLCSENLRIVNVDQMVPQFRDNAEDSLAECLNLIKIRKMMITTEELSSFLHCLVDNEQLQESIENPCSDWSVLCDLQGDNDKSKKFN